MAETVDLKSLARRVLARGSGQDSVRDALSRDRSVQEEPARQSFAEPSRFFPASYSGQFSALQDNCPSLVEEHRRQQAVQDGRRFLARWGDQAHALGWTAQDLFGLQPLPDKPTANYRRLSQYEGTGLIWLLQGRQVVALTENRAIIETATGNVRYRRYNEPALGPLGDTLDDCEPESNIVTPP
jgi:hypothetical protein